MRLSHIDVGLPLLDESVAAMLALAALLLNSVNIRDLGVRPPTPARLAHGSSAEPCHRRRSWQTTVGIVMVTSSRLCHAGSQPAACLRSMG
jgi:hypothetical protein